MTSRRYARVVVKTRCGASWSARVCLEAGNRLTTPHVAVFVGVSLSIEGRNLPFSGDVEKWRHSKRRDILFLVPFVLCVPTFFRFFSLVFVASGDLF